MSARELAGRALARAIREETAAQASALAAAGRPARLVIVTATDDDASGWYVRSLAKAASGVGVECEVVDLGPAADAATIRRELTGRSADPQVSGVMLQTPLPPGASAAELAEAIAVEKDVDGANPWSLGRLAAGRPAFAPATAEAVVRLLAHYEVPLAGRPAVVVGRSTVVGKPLAQLLLDRDATVTVCHSRTADLVAVTRSGELVVAAVGRTHLIGPEYVSPGAVVVDVGTNPTPDGGLAGDVDPAVAAHADALSPVPGGVGPVTTALLLAHTVTAAI
ncbi:bifunctional 5,10-methylenetetrahydrofolate dehydrogenase/5,10-methenyltetrahydrofolate cyclohydrolase [Natronosporangium hydrolyticum]|uniref:Bifunctional protein FolD n=1 Tax=Natronosporangium hydrolyticum TaxID=2811111 RepID=A0A895YFZ4_9ACTN|nr:bifunctional 5,10-methylenetetrahydrofolate dehydrogenase/5,10-methenyltetrahydrofolate cyclohydrolase [Natronosporangium hydrolyticum]QSB16491.1 bifunctional 5,10-methylenetetrahydrofolate dehydrogenase/5,10-methenyltetrahydrofolate cyclohydrolase [Natronosporangium hydrolyticum]